MKKKERSNIDKLFPLLTVILVGGGIAFLVWLSASKTGSGSLSVFEIDNSSAYWKGAEEAPVVLTEFSDFQCPACASFQPILEKILADYPAEVKIYYRHFPLPQHEFAQKAAEAAEAAGEQGKFWEMHDLFFENQEKLSEPAIKEFAKELDLEGEVFNQALDSGKFRQKVLADLSDARRLEVNSTPSLFINGKKVPAGTSFDEFKALIEKELISGRASPQDEQK